MAKQTTYEARRFVTVYGQGHDAIASVTELVVIEPEIAGKERRPAKLVQQRNDLFVQYSFSTDVLTDQTGTYAPAAEKKQLALIDVLVQQNHAGIGSGAA